MSKNGKRSNAVKIILASGSPRRKEILEGLGVEFRVLSADTDESCRCPDPCDYATELARRKGQAAWGEIKLRLKDGVDDTDAVIISADTVVATEYEILGKPTDKECNVLANCVGYAFGRFHEIANRPEMDFFDPVNAELIYASAKKHGLTCGNTPKLGALIGYVYYKYCLSSQ